MVIEIRRGSLFLAAAICLASCLGVVGYSASPRDDSGSPVLLMPDVRAMERYRRGVGRWVSGWRAVDSGLEGVLAGQGEALLALSQQAQRAFHQSASLAQAVDAAGAPPALLGLQELAAGAADGYLGASAASARWLSAPSDANRGRAEDALASARARLSELEANEWVRPRDAQP